MRRVEGISLAELVMVIVILGILGAFVGPVLLNAMRSYEGAQKSANTSAKVRYAMERIAREMRDIRRQTTDARALDIVSSFPSASSLAFFKTDGTRVELTASGAVVNLAYSGLTGMLFDQVQPGSFSMVYFQQNATAVAANASVVAFIQVSMSIVEGHNTFPARLRVDLRNPE